jgi:tetratricopeptide (TPR) repeat protein
VERQKYNFYKKSMRIINDPVCVCLVMLCLAVYTPAIARQDIFNQPPVLDSVKKSLDQLYNFDFDNATHTIASVKAKYPDHPAVLIFDCLHSYWKNFPVSVNEANNTSYRQTLLTTLQKTKAFLKNDDDNPERIFYLLFVDILLARQCAADDRSWAAADYAMDAYRLIKKGFKLQDTFKEFYFSTGLYKYYREFFPEQNKIYKPIAWVLGFPAGNKVQGLEFLDKAANQTVFVMPEALLLTSAIYLKYESNLPKALAYAESINARYPHNLYFKVLYLENLIQSAQYVKAETSLAAIAASNNSYYKLPTALFRGMIEERYYKRLGEAEKWYLEVIKFQVKWDTNNHIGLAYYGLGNIYKQRGDKEKMKKYYKKANSLCEYLSVKEATED